MLSTPRPWLRCGIPLRGRPSGEASEDAPDAGEAGWDDEQILEAIAAAALEAFTAMVNVAGEVPVDGSPEVSRTLQAA